MNRIMMLTTAFINSFILTASAAQAAGLMPLTLMSEASSLAPRADQKILAMRDKDSSLREIGRVTDHLTGLTHIRYEQLYQGVPVWGYHVIASQNKAGVTSDLHGTLVTGIAADLSQAQIQARPIRFTPEQLLVERKSAITSQGNARKGWIFSQETAYKLIYLTPDNRAHRVVLVSFFADTTGGGHPTRPVYFMDDTSGQVISTFDSLAFDEATGPGGNEGVGRYEYGVQFPALEVQYNAATEISTLSTTHVTTVNLAHTEGGSTPHSFKGKVSSGDAINGAYSPLNDAHYFGNQIFNMYWAWLNVPPLTFPLQMKVHYSNNYENAFWDGRAMTFGDGQNMFYPLVALDVSSHEVSHGFTAQHSNLTYQGESGGMNEAFSDMAGEAAKYFVRGHNDFLVGHEIMKNGGALRYMDDPTKDGASIGSAYDYRVSLDVHHSSGVYNKAFYTLATSPGWDTKKAFVVFAKANQSYWEPLTNFIQGAIGVCHAARDLGYETKDIEAAFGAVDIDLAQCAEKAMNSIFSTENKLKRGEEQNFGPFVVGEGERVKVELTGTGDADLYVQVGTKPTRTQYRCRPYKSTSNEQCKLKIASRSSELYIMVRSDFKQSDYKLVVSGAMK